jgi:hypothetical protein
MTRFVHGLLLASALSAVVLLLPARTLAQDNACAAKDRRQACSVQCCGRWSCPPSCEVDCVKACVDACNAPDRGASFGERKRSLQLRCGNRSIR